jgi:hypothetical protein
VGPGIVVAVVAGVLVVVFGLQTVLARRRGLGVGGSTIVRCSQGHLFTTLWVPGASFTAVRLGSARFQHCPVGHHWVLVRPVAERDLTDAEREEAKQHRDRGIP